MKSNIKKFKADCFIGSDAWADVEFFPHLEKLNALAKQLRIEVFVTHSFREMKQKLRGAIVEPASHSCHLVGHAIDFNLFSREMGFVNSDRMGLLKSKPDWELHSSNRLPMPAQKFLHEIIADKDLRWGGLFKPEPDEVHVDDDLWHRNPDLWREKFYEIHY